MMMRRIYIETSIVSYLTSRPSNDLIKSACQQLTKLWWEHGRASTVPYISPYVIEEASLGDPQAASDRLNALREISVLPIAP